MDSRIQIWMVEMCDFFELHMNKSRFCFAFKEKNLSNKEQKVSIQNKWEVICFLLLSLWFIRLTF